MVQAHPGDTGDRTIPQIEGQSTDMPAVTRDGATAQSYTSDNSVLSCINTKFKSFTHSIRAPRWLHGHLGDILPAVRHP